MKTEASSLLIILPGVCWIVAILCAALAHTGTLWKLGSTFCTPASNYTASILSILTPASHQHFYSLNVSAGNFLLNRWGQIIHSLAEKIKPNVSFWTALWDRRKDTLMSMYGFQSSWMLQNDLLWTVLHLIIIKGFSFLQLVPSVNTFFFCSFNCNWNIYLISQH